MFSWANWMNLRAANHEVAQAEADYMVALQSLAQRVAQQYFAVLQAHDTLDAVEAAREAVQRQLDQADRRFEVGLIAITDVQEARAARDDAAAAVIAAKRSLASAEEQLRATIGEKPAIRPGSAAKRTTLGSLRRAVGAWTATWSTIAPVTPSASSEAASARSTSATVVCGSQTVPVAEPSAPGMSSTAPFGAIVSSVVPSVSTALARIVLFIVSPVTSAAAMIAVPSRSPTTISALRARRRPTLRTASRRRMRFRNERTARAPSGISRTGAAAA